MAVTNQTAPGWNLLQTTIDERVDYQRGDRIEYKDRAKTPIAAYVDTKGASRSSKTQEIHLFEGELMNRLVDFTGGTFNGTVVGDTDVGTVASGDTDNLVVGMTLLVTDNLAASGNVAGTLVRIDSIVADTSITFSYLAGTVPVAGTDSFIPITFASPETTDTGPTFTDIEPGLVTGRMTLLKKLVSMSITERDSAVYATTTREQEKIERSRMEFMRNREANFWFSRSSANVGSNNVTTSMGIHEQMTLGATFVDANGAISDADFGNAIANGAKYYDSTEFVAFHGAPALAGLFTLGAGKLLTSAGDTKYGFRAQSVDVAQYKINMMHSQLFDLVGAPFANMMIGLDLGSIQNWYLKGEGQMTLKKNVDPKAAASGENISHMWRAQEGVSIVVQERHWCIENLSSPT